jgi:hypothetical protein
MRRMRACRGIADIGEAYQRVCRLLPLPKHRQISRHVATRAASTSATFHGMLHVSFTAKGYRFKGGV